MTSSDIEQAIPSRGELLKALGLQAAPSPFSVTESPLLTLATRMAIGAGLALLMAPRSGAETRKSLLRQVTPKDGNEEFAEQVQKDGGLPGPQKHIAP